MGTEGGGVKSIRVEVGLDAYPVLVGCGLLRSLGKLLEEHAPAHRYAVVSDSNVATLYGDSVLQSLGNSGLDAQLFSFGSGECHKNRSTWKDLSDRLLKTGFGRDSCIVALGGGVTGDLAGFVAATYMRGIPVVQVPTSLLAMVDSSVGGKTGVDVAMGKNLIGAFHPPLLVVADPEVIETLPRVERAQGLIEAVKHGAIMDSAYFEVLAREMEEILDGKVSAVERAVVRSVELKSEVVSDDEREFGRRQILNFGHTLGHAIEAASSYDVSHGTAVGYGMVLEARIGTELGVTAKDTLERIEEVVEEVGLLRRSFVEASSADIMSYLTLDKKVRDGRTLFVLLSHIGSVYSARDSWSHPVQDQVVQDAVNYFVTNLR